MECVSDREPWLDLLRRWLDNEQRNEHARAFDLLVELVARLPREWARKGRQGPSSRDFLLLNKLVGRLQEWSLHTEALQICDVARHYARAQADLYGALHFELLGAQSCVALLDLHSAAAVLARVLNIAPGALVADPPAAIAAASMQTVPGVSEVDLHLLRVAALLSLSRYLAAYGRLGGAEVALCRVIELLELHELPTISAPEVRVWLAEVRLDRGDFLAVESVLRAAENAESAWPTRVRLKLLEAQLCHLRGRFSQADDLLRPIAQETQPAALQPLFVSAAWQRIHVLASLNRLDEAEALLNGLAGAMGRDPGEIDAMRTLLDARRSAATTALHIPPPPRQVLVACESSDAPPEKQEAPDLATAMATVRRMSERVRDDYGRLFNQALLCLHRGDVDPAMLICAHLSEWSAQIESELISARQKHLWTLVYYYWGDWAAAEEYATDALNAYTALGMLGEQWAMCRVLEWSLHRRGAARALLDKNRERLIRLQEELRSQLHPTDQALYSLNKWSVVDEEVAAICRSLHDASRKMAGGTFFPRYRDWKLRRAATRALRRIHACRQLRTDAAPQGNETTLHQESSAQKDVYRLALDSIQRRLANPDRPSLTKRAAPVWLPADTAVLHYITLPDRLELLLMTRAGCTLIPLRAATSRPDLWERSRATLVNLASAPAWHGDSRRLTDLATRVGLPDVLERLPTAVRHLAIVPDDILVHVPFAALPVEGRPLVSTHDISVLPTMVWLPQSPGEVRTYQRALGVAVESSPLNDSYPPLIGAVDELAAIRAAWLDGWRRLVNDAASRANVTGTLSEVELTHFACHGDFFVGNPERSGLLLTDGWLTVADVYRLRLNDLRLAVLASCWGASATVLPGGMHIGLPFAFLDQGARAVVASLWKVPHESNIAFTRDLYRAIADSGPIAGLAETQREWARRAPPSEWAGYVAYAAGVAPRQPIRWLIDVQQRLQRWRRCVPQPSGLQPTA